MLILFFLIKIETKPAWQKPFKRFGVYLALIGLERCLIEAIRINPVLIGTFSQAQVIGAAVVLVGLVLVLRSPLRTA